MSCLFLVLAGVAAWGDEFSLTPGAALKEEFNDNIFYSTANGQSSFISTVSPRLSLLDRTERLDARLDAGVDLLFYTKDSRLDSIDQSYSAGAKYRLTQLSGLSAKASFNHSTRPDSFLETTGQVSTQGSNRQSYSITGDMGISERMSGSLGYAYEQLDYSNNNTSLSDYRSHSGTLGLIYDMGNILPLLKVRGNLGFGRYEFTSLTLDQYTATVGFGYNFHELLSVQADAGAIYSRSAFMETEFVPPASFTQTRRDTDSLGWIGSLVFSYKGETDTASLNFSRSVQGSYGSSGAVERTSVTMELGRRFTYELSGRLSGGYYLNKSGQQQFSLQAIDQTTWRGATSLRYDFNRDVNVDCNYEYAQLKNNLARTDAGRNMVFIRLSVQKPFFE